ncbi:MAG: hypothetical protein E7812_14840 [Phenylobacterium sp.]|nr:MAG: hypothetical protein E7812_14840 [Phenylobacterium sp.]
MLLLAMTMFAVTVPPWGPSPVGPDGYRKDWVLKPNALDIEYCVRKFVQRPEPTYLVLSCRSAPGDHVSDCTVIENSRALDDRYEKAALCAAKLFRIRVTDASGVPVSGVEVKAPFQVRPPRAPVEPRPPEPKPDR